MRLGRSALLAVLFATATARPAAAQPSTAAALKLKTQSSPLYSALASTSAATLDSSAAAPLPLPKYGGWVSVTKWATLAAAVGLGAAGAVWHHDAQDNYEELDALCKAEPDTCRDRNPDGSYRDPALEDLYQTVLKKDGHARTAFVGAQVSFGVSALLFILDFQQDDGPGNIPYDPDGQKSALRFTARPGELAIRYYLN